MNTLSAEQLRIRPAERTALIEIRELFATGVFKHDQHLDVEVPDGFNMIAISEESECGTTCCIGGWMFRAMERDRTAPCVRADDYVNEARSPALVPLFLPFRGEDEKLLLDESGIEPDFPWELIPPAFALKAIDNFLTTGKPDWIAVCVTPNQEIPDVPSLPLFHDHSFA